MILFHHFIIFHFVIYFFRVLLRTRKKVHVSPKDWRTVFDLMSANIIRTKSKVRVSPKDWRTFYFSSAKLLIFFQIHNSTETNSYLRGVFLHIILQKHGFNHHFFMN